MNDTAQNIILEKIIKNFKLSKEQQIIVDSTQDNILVIACPGSGKTHTLIARYINMLLKHNLKPEETIMITFTKKAGIEILNRLNKLVPDKVPYYVGTIHGLSYKILKKYNNLNNIIMDESDTKAYLEDIIDNQNIENTEIIKLKIQTIFDQSSITVPFDMKSVLIKNKLYKYLKEFKLIHKLYKLKKKKDNLIDFNDLMIMFNDFLLTTKSSDFKNEIKYVFFDEYQDVNSIQNNILLQLSNNSNIMVVGDDAQSIYSFRGSSVKYILNYNLNKPHKMYLLEENYRSTSSIVNFCQDIISHNLNQFDKNVKSIDINNDNKPHVNNFKSIKEQFEWITNDILIKKQNGTSLSNIVILSRNNNQLNNIELYLQKKDIPISKHLGLLLLNKPHIKDFLAFIVILLNKKTLKYVDSIYLNRIICLHPGYDNVKAKQILNDCLIEKELPDLHNLFIQLKKMSKDSDKTKIIITYLEQFWEGINNNKNDIYILLSYLKDSSLNDFINNIYLNQEVNNTSIDSVYLSTIHGSKGLEWDNVYIIDMNSKDLSYYRSKYYLDELYEIDEERRLFYVACSRAKHTLIINYHNNPSPLIREIDQSLYIKNFIGDFDKIKPALNLSLDIKKHLNIIGYYNISKYLIEIVNKKSIINKTLDIPNKINISIINNIIKCLVLKIVQKNYSSKINNDNIIHNNWKEIIDSIIHSNSFNNINVYSDFLNNDEIYKYYINLEKGICKMINTINPTNIFINYNVSYCNVSCIIDILCDNTIITLNSLIYCNNICEKIMHAYLLNKNKNNITNIIFYNPIIGDINNIDITKINVVNFKKMIY